VVKLESEYRSLRSRLLVDVASNLEHHIKNILKDVPRIDRITARAKAVDRFIAKANKMDDDQKKYDDPINEIQDLIGARIITYYLSDVDLVAAELENHIRFIENHNLVPDSTSKFGYEGQHYIMFIPSDVLPTDYELNDNDPKLFELQIKTLHQHAWGEASHDIAYKSNVKLNADQQRRVAYAAAQAWGADRIFEELSKELLHESS